MSAPTADAPSAARRPHRVGIVVGLLREADVLAPAIRALPAPHRPLLFCSGGGVERAASGVERMLADGVAGLVSFGMAGGLERSLKPGDVVVGERIVAPDGTAHDADAAWSAAFVAPPAEALGATVCRLATLAGVDRPVTTAAEKDALFRRTGAFAVDMESHVVGRAAARAGIPFIAVRAIADPADRAIPSAALAGLAPDGRTRAWAVLTRLALAPWQIPAVLRLAADSAAALGALRGVALRDARRLFGLPGVNLAHEALDMP